MIAFIPSLGFFSAGFLAHCLIAWRSNIGPGKPKPWIQHGPAVLVAKCVDIFKHLQTIFFSSSKFLAVQTNNHDSLGFSGLMVGTGFQHQLYADMQAFIPFLLTHSCCGESVESRIKRFSCSLCCRNEQRNVAMGGLLMDPGGSLRPTFWYSVWNYRRRSQQLQQRER